MFVVAVVALLVTPSHPASALDGLPLKPIGTIVALALPALIFGLWRALPVRLTMIGANALGGLIVLKLGLALLSPEHGLQASYFDNSRLQGRPERSTEFSLAGATRLDRQLDFGGDEFPVYFFNDSERFNFYRSGSPQRRQLPFSVRWDGFVWAPSAGPYDLRLTASGQASVTVGSETLSVNAEGRASTDRTVALAAGPNPFNATYSRRPERSPDFRVEWTVDGTRSTLSAPYLRPTSRGPDLARDLALAQVAHTLDAVGLIALLVVIAGGVVAVGGSLRAAPSWAERARLIERPLLATSAMVFVALGSLPRLDRFGKMVYFGGGQDWLLHETLARDILLNGPLMTLGKSLGEGRAFYAQPLYPYYLAGLHAVLGEDQFGVTAAQVAGLGYTGIVLWFLARELFGRAIAWLTLALFLGFAAVQLDWVARRLLSENLYFLVLPLALLATVRTHRSGSRVTLIAAGILLGVSTLTRGTTLLLLPIFAALLWRRVGAVGAALLVVSAVSVIGLVPIRNALVAGRPALLATSGGVNMEKFHRPTDVVRLSRIDENPVYNRLGLDQPTREVLEFMRQDPLGYIQSCLILAAYTVGYGAALDEAQVPLYPDLIAFSALYLLTLALCARARQRSTWYVHAFIGAHFLSMIIFTPYDYENRLVLPMFLPMIIFVVLGLSEAAAWAVRRVAGRQAEPLSSGVQPAAGSSAAGVSS